MSSDDPRGEIEERALARELLEYRMFCKDPWYAVQRGWVITEDEHADITAGETALKAFPDKDYLRVIAQLVTKSQTGVLMKTRQLMMTWLFCWLLLWEAITKQGRLCVAQGKREEDVLAKGHKGLMGRIRCIRENLPAHVQPVVLEFSKSTEVYANGSTIMAIPQGDDVIRSLTASAVLMDELAFHPEGEQAWTAALPTVKGGGWLWGVTTPNGREFCYLQADERLKWDDWQKWPSVRQGLHGYRNTKGMQLVALHYTADPDRRSVEYQTEAQRGYTNINLYRQENELDFSLTSGEGVYANEFKEERHVLTKKFYVNPKMPLYRGWDFGYNGQAVSFFQQNHIGQLIWFDQVFYKRVPLQEVVQEVRKRTLLHLGHINDDGSTKEYIEVPLYDLEGNPIKGASLAKREETAIGNVQDFGDPSSEAHNTKGETDRMTLASFGIVLHSKTTTGRKADLVEQVRALLLPRSDGTPGLLVCSGPSLEMKSVIAGLKGGYRYPESRLGKADKMLPLKDGFFDHIFDSAQYAIDWIKPMRGAASEDDSEIGVNAWWKGTEWTDNAWNDEDSLIH